VVFWGNKKCNFANDPVTSSPETESGNKNQHLETKTKTKQTSGTNIGYYG